MEPQQGVDLVSGLTSALIGNARQLLERSSDVDDTTQPRPPRWERSAPDDTEIAGVSYSTLRSLVPDVEASMDRFAFQDRLLRRMHLPSPSVETDDGIIPLDLGLNRVSVLRSSRVLYETVVRLYEYPFFFGGPQALRIVPTSPDEAESGLRKQLQRFLRRRLYSDNRLQNSANSAIGYQFEVTTISPGLRIHYSPAYFVNTNLAFGAPTSPVRACLQPGRYIFGAYLPDPGYWSSTEYDVPGPSHSAHMNV